ncbi:MAG TPA: transporter [Candidatus Baltobacteraceae bacterium]|nr:transporter [Candidatus Baltobacteraceae bacterium]
MLNLGMILIFAASLTVSPSPSPSPAPTHDPCGGARSNLLAVLDRPSIGFSPCAVKQHETVIEAGYSNAASATAATPTYPQGFLRFGAAPQLEVDLIAGGRFDSGFGAKYEFWHDASRAFGADFLYTAPTGSASLTAGAPTQTINLDYSTPLAGNFSIAPTLGMQSSYAADLSGRGGRFFSLLPSVVVSDQWNPRAQAYIEAYGQTRTRPDGGAQFGLDVALQYLLAPQLEFDVEAGQTANDVTRSHYAGFGFGVRF